MKVSTEGNKKSYHYICVFVEEFQEALQTPEAAFKTLQAELCKCVLSLP